MLNARDYTVILFCPLVIEQRAACLMLDRMHDGAIERSAGQSILYTFGEIASFNVAIAGYPAGEVGIGVSGSIVSEVLRDFPVVKFGFLVGIGAGMPSPSRHIHLGDVAVAVPSNSNPGVIGYDLVKVEEGEVRLKQWLNATHPLLRSTITHIRVHEDRNEVAFSRHLEEAIRTAPDFRRPNGPSCSLEACNPSVQRHQRNEPRAHYGTILSGNGVIKSKKKRDELRDKHDGIAIEMEAGGILTKLPVAVVRGISDFADARKNDEWHAYSALVAAAYAKEMILRLGPARTPAAPEHQSNLALDLQAHLALAMPEPCNFIGRDSELARLEAWLCSKSQRLFPKTVVALSGLGGIGKSQLVAEFVRQQREREPGRFVFWVNAESQEAWERNIISLLKISKRTRTEVEVSDAHPEQRHSLVNTFFAELQETNRGQWTLVVDQLDTEVSMQQEIDRHLNRLSCGSVILISRSQTLMQKYHNRIHIKGLQEADAIGLLRKEIDDPHGQEEEYRKLGNMLNGHPFALALAASSISLNLTSATQHIERWESREDFANIASDERFIHSLDISYERLSHTHPLATKILTLFAFLDHRDLWFDLCAEGAPGWLGEILSRRQFQDAMAQLHNLSFIESKMETTSQERVYELHPVIHEFVRWKARQSVEQCVRCAVSLVAAKVPRSNVSGFLELIQRLEPHAIQCMIHLGQGRAGRGMDLVELEKLGNLWRYLGRLDEACRLYEGILKVIRVEETPDQFTIELMAGVENNLGLVYHAQRKYDMALQLYQSSYNRLGRESMEEQAAPQITSYNSGRSLLMLGRLDEALEAFTKAEVYFSRLKQDLGTTSPPAGQLHIYGQILNDIGEAHLRKKNLEVAERYFNAAFEGLARSLHELHPLTFAVRLNVARLCMERSRYTTANKILGFIVATYKQWWGKRSSETMRAMAELATSHTRHGEMRQLMGDGGEAQFATAIELWQDVLAFYQEVHGSSSDLCELAQSNLQKLQWLSAGVEEDRYRQYYP